MRNLKPILIFLLTLLVYSCVQEEKEAETTDSTWISVYARYLASDNAYKTEVTFFKGDSVLTALPTTIEGEVKIGNQALQSHQLSEGMVRYQTDFKGDFLEELTLKVNSQDINRKQWSMAFKKIPEFQIAEQKISLSQGSEIIFSESFELNEFEEMIIMLNDSKKQTTSISIKGPVSLEKLSLGPEKLTSLTNTGPGNLYLLSKRSGEVDEKVESWNYLLEYYSNEVSVEIVK